MIKHVETLEGYLTNGLTWRIERERGNMYLSILWANGEELETIELKLEDIERLGALFYEAKGLYGAIAPSERAASKISCTHEYAVEKDISFCLECGELEEGGN